MIEFNPRWGHGLLLVTNAAVPPHTVRSSSPQKHKLNELRDARPPDEVEEENAWIAFKEAQAVSQNEPVTGRAENHEGEGEEGAGLQLEGSPFTRTVSCRVLSKKTMCLCRAWL